MRHPDSPRAALLLHGGTPHRRAAVAAALHPALQAAWGATARVHRSSRAAEAAKWLADPGVVGVVLLDLPPDAEAVRRAAERPSAQASGRWVIAADPAWTPAAIWEAIVSAVGRSVSDRP